MSTTAPSARRVPTQERSRRRVAKVLDAAAKIVVRDGVEALTTREIAKAAGVPIATLYQYFADKEAVLIALTQRDTDDMDAEVAAALAALEVVTVATVVRATMEAFVRVYHRRRAFVEIYLRGRTNIAVHHHGREHNARVAASLRDYALAEGLISTELTLDRARLAVEVGDRIFQLAFEDADEGDPDLVEEGIVLVTGYLERYATATGLGEA
jgi:AcrR family transcriptional regulator